jgi:hypothetical protein
MSEVHHAGTADDDGDDARTAFVRDEETALLEDTATDPYGGLRAHEDGNTTYKEEVWGFIGNTLCLNLRSYASLS